MIYLGSVKPFDKPYMNYLEIFNEATILVVSYHLLIFSDYVPSTLIKYYFGYSIIAITSLNLFVNMLIIIYFTIISLKDFVQRLIAKIKQKR